MHKAQKVKIKQSYDQLMLLIDQATEFFAINEWNWSNENVEKLNKELTEVDKETFNFDLSTLNWADYMVDYVKVDVC